MRQLVKKEIIDVMRYAGNYQREVFQLYDIDIIEVTKYNQRLTISVHYNPSVVPYKKLFSLFRDNFVNYKEFIDTDDCYSIPLLSKQRSAHFVVRFKL